MSEKLTTGSDVGKLLSDETRSVLNTSNVGLSLQVMKYKNYIFKIKMKK